MSGNVVEEMERILAETDEADDVLRAAVALILAQPGVVWAAVAFVDGGGFVHGPTAGTPDDARRVRVPITYKGDSVGQLLVDGKPDSGFLEHLADRLAPYVLIGWDTAGESWEP